MKTKKDFNAAVDLIEEVLRNDSIIMNRHEEWFNGVVHTIIAVKEMIKESDLEEGE